MKAIQIMIFSALVLASLMLSARAEYKPVDVSDIKGEQRKELMEAVRGVNKMPMLARDCYVCEQLGLCFHADGSEGGCLYQGYPATTNHLGAKFVSKAGRLSAWQDAVNSAGGQWGKSWDEAHKFKSGAVLSFFKKDINRIVCNTAKYMLKEMPDVTKQAMLASIGRMLYKEDGTTLPASGYSARVRIGSGFDVNYNGNASDGYFFLDSTGKERSLKDAFAADSKKKSWRDTVRRCENLVGAWDILALFPDEVKAMRKYYNRKLARVKEHQEEVNETLLTAADEMLASLPQKQKYTKLAAAMGLYFQSHQTTGYDGGCLSSSVMIFLPSGEMITGDDVRNNANPGILQQIPHEVILEYYKEPLQQMARHMAADRFRQMPPLLRDAFRALWSGDLVTADGRPAKIEDKTIYVETFDRKWYVPWESMDRRNAYFMSSNGKSILYWSIYSTYWKEWVQTIRLAHLCAHILGRKVVLEYMPPVGENEGKELPQASQKSAMGSAANDSAPGPTEESETPRKTAMGSVSLEDTVSSEDRLHEEGIAALRRMSPALRRAWLAENMGFCYTQSDAPAYMAPHAANDNALFVDEQGKECKLSEIATDKMAPDWVAATRAALAVGHRQIAGTFDEELKALAVQTATHILNAIDETPRSSWLAEVNHLIFNPNGQSAYPPNERSLSVESGFKVRSSGVSYARNLYYNPQGKITQPAVGNTGESCWLMLYRCANVAGIEAINVAFKADVDAMRAAYEKSPFYKK